MKPNHEEHQPTPYELRQMFSCFNKWEKERLEEPVQIDIDDVIREKEIHSGH